MSAERFIARFAVLLAVACVTVVGATVLAVRSPALRTHLGLGRPPAYRVDAQIDVPDRLYRSSSHTLFIFARSSCAACQAAKPTFAALADRLRRASSDVVLITGGADARDEAAYASDLGLDASHLVPMNLSALRVKLVPTLVLVDQGGRVVYSIEGVPTDADQARLIEAAASRSPR